MTFLGWISQGQVATYERLGGHICNVFMSNFFSELDIPKFTKNRLIFDRVIQKNKKVDILGDTG